MASDSSTRWVSTKKNSQGGLGECLLDADALEGLRGRRAIGVRDGIAPGAGGAVAALGRPDAAGMLANVAQMSDDRGSDLGANTLIGAEQGEVAVRGGAGDDFNETGFVEVAEAGDDVALKRVKVFEGLSEETLPEAGGFGVLNLTGLSEEGFVFAGGDNFSVEVVGELRGEGWMGKLLHQHGGEVEIAMEADAFSLEDGGGRAGGGGRFRRRLHAATPYRAARCHG